VELGVDTDRRTDDFVDFVAKAVGSDLMMMMMN